MKDFFKRFTSRKFLLAIASCLTLAANKQYTEIIFVVVAYLAAETGVDIARAKGDATETAGAALPIWQSTDDDKDLEPNKSVITPGLHRT